jgi:alpha-tubulin suppressor-like RCC1 family protein
MRVLAGGTVSCWGSNGTDAAPSGALGHDPTADPSCATPVPSRCNTTAQAVPGLSGAREIAVGASHACALKNDDTVVCWGRNSLGLLGHDPALDGDGAAGQPHPTPAPVTGLSGVAHIVAGAFHTCAVKRTGEVLCWGDDDEGQLGDAPDAGFTHSFVPRLVVGL